MYKLVDNSDGYFSIWYFDTEGDSDLVFKLTSCCRASVMTLVNILNEQKMRRV